jgi:hypothetical protein
VQRDATEGNAVQRLEVEVEVEEKEDLPALPVATATLAKPFALEVQRAGPKPRKPSVQQEYYEAFHAAREVRMASDFVPDVEWAVERINTSLKFVTTSDLDPRAWASVWLLYFQDEHWGSIDPPWPLGAFVSQKAKFISMASRNGDLS